MLKKFLILLLLVFLPLYLLVNKEDMLNANEGDFFLLPGVNQESPLLQLISSRSSIRSFEGGRITSSQLGDLLFAAAGISWDVLSSATRAIPSAGATNPLVFYAYLQQVEGFEEGLYRYNPTSHGLIGVLYGELGEDLASISLNQSFIERAQLVIIIAGDYAKTTSRYGERGIRYVHMEAGHGAQNILLKAEELGFGAVIIGAFYDKKLKDFLLIEEEPLLIIPIGLRP